MTQQTLFYRKIAYIVLIAILLFPLYRLGSPSQRESDGSMSAGGPGLSWTFPKRILERSTLPEAP